MDKKIVATILIIITTIMLGIIVVIISKISINQTSTITNYEQCVSSGGRIQESFPAKCVTDDGRSFVQPIQ
jgi:hypothetical protein